MVNEQLTFRFGWRDGFHFSNYYPASNEAAIHFLKSIDFSSSSNTSSEHFAYFWGSDSVGKSHLLQAVCQQVADAGHSVAYLPLAEFDAINSEMFGGLEQLSLICIDDVQVVAGNDLWEEALFHFFNRMRDHNTPLLISGLKPPAQLNLQLPDIKSRIGWGLTLQIKLLNDVDKLLALQKRASMRGMVLSDESGQFLLSRYSRDLNDLFNLLDKLDKASLSEQRRLTIPFIRQQL